MACLYRLTIAEQARDDIAQARRWLTQPGSGRRGHTRYSELLRAIQDLRATPGRWPPSEIAGFRERTITGYRLIYRVDDDTQHVRVLRVFGPFQDRTDP